MPYIAPTMTKYKALVSAGDLYVYDGTELVALFNVNDERRAQELRRLIARTAVNLSPLEYRLLEILTNRSYHLADLNRHYTDCGYVANTFYADARAALVTKGILNKQSSFYTLSDFGRAVKTFALWEE